MNILRVFAEDLFSYEKLDLPLANRGLLLIEGENRDAGGSNGAGKSSIFEILTWVLFGVTNRGIRGDEVIREDKDHNPILGKSRGVVEIELDGHHVQIFRHRRHKQYANKLLLVVDKVEISSGTDKETQNRINELLQIDVDAFTAAVMFPQGNNGFAGQTDANQKSILDSVQGTIRFDAAKNRAKVRAEDARRILIGTETTIVSTAAAIASVTSTIAATQTQEADWTKKHAEAVAEIENRLKLLIEPTLSDDINRTIESCDRWLEVHEEPLKGLDESIATTNQRLMTMTQQIGGLQGQLALLQRQVVPMVPVQLPYQRPNNTSAAIREHAQQLREQYAVLKSSVNKKGLLLNSKRAERARIDAIVECNGCGQTLTQEAKSKVIEKLDTEILELEGEALSEATQMDNIEVQGKSLNEILRMTSAWELYDQQVQQYENALKVYVDPAPLNEQLAAVKSSQEAHQAYHRACLNLKSAHQQCLAQRSQAQSMLSSHAEVRARYEAQKEAIQKELETKRAETNPFDGLAEKQSADLERLNRKLKMYTAIKAKLYSDIDALEFWVEGFGNRGVKSLILDHAVPTLQDNANLYLDALSNGTAHLDISTVSTLSSGETRDRLNISVKYRNGGGSFNKNSGGEQRRVNLALLFALGDLGASRARAAIKLRLLDEPFDDLDSVGAEQVVNLLNTYIVPKSGSVLVMSHSDHIKSLIPNRITVIKERGISRIEQ